jgi:hypothetical protein
MKAALIALALIASVAVPVHAEKAVIESSDYPGKTVVVDCDYDARFAMYCQYQGFKAQFLFQKMDSKRAADLAMSQYSREEQREILLVSAWLTSSFEAQKPVRKTRKSIVNGQYANN